MVYTMYLDKTLRLQYLLHAHPSYLVHASICAILHPAIHTTVCNVVCPFVHMPFSNLDVQIDGELKIDGCGSN